jgi:cardiolipin synthase
MADTKAMAFEWLTTGDRAFAAAGEAISTAQLSIRLEAYYFADSQLGLRVLNALVQARQRGVLVRVLVDAVGSIGLTDDFWEPLWAAGGEVRWFNPLSLERFAIRDHRKLLVCDETVAFIGGFNIAPEYEGDGVARGWRDVGLSVEGDLAFELAAAFDEMFARAEFRHKRIFRLRRFATKRAVPARDWQLLLSGPGRGRNPFQRALRSDLASARNIQIIAAYFLPPVRLRRLLERVARRGSRVQLILAGQSDVPLAQLAARSLYRRLLKAGVEIYEYGPQILHAKLLVADEVVYVGSANLDPRSLRINYELMVRLTKEEIAAQARLIFADTLTYCRVVERRGWRASQGGWQRLKQRWAYFLLARLDPYVAGWQYRSLRE